MQSLDKTRYIAGGIIISALGALFYNLLPVYLGAAQDHRGYDNEQIGLIGTVFFLGYTLTSISAFFWIRRIDWRAVSYLAVAIAALGLIIASGSSTYAILLSGEFVAGCGFAGIYSVGTTLLSDTSNPARWYGAKITAEAALGVVLLLLAPAIIMPRWGFLGLSVSMIGTLILLAPSILLLPAQGVRQVSASNLDTDNEGNAPVWISLIACGLFICGQTAIWGFVERMGANAGFEATLVGALLAISLAFAVSGSLLAAWLGNRIGCFKPLAWSHLIFFAGVVALTRADLFEAYALGACLVLFSVGLGISYSVSTIAEYDPDGRYVALSVPAIGIGVMLGPGVAGLLADGSGHAPVLGFGSATLLASLLGFFLAVKYRQGRAD